MSVHFQFKSELKYKSNQDRSSALPRFETGRPLLACCSQTALNGSTDVLV